MPPKQKKMQQQLRQLAGVAYEREMSAATQALLEDFHRWEKKEMDVFKMNEKIHAFHHGISRELYVRYTGMNAAFAVASALLRGILRREEVGDDVYSSVEGLVMALSSSEPE